MGGLYTAIMFDAIRDTKEECGADVNAIVARYAKHGCTVERTCNGCCETLRFYNVERGLYLSPIYATISEEFWEAYEDGN